jgi:hypothetical protein
VRKGPSVAGGRDTVAMMLPTFVFLLLLYLRNVLLELGA